MPEVLTQVDPDDSLEGPICHVFVVEGHTEPRLRFFPGPSRCGSITDGVAFEHGSEGGHWVISYADLLRMCELAGAARRASEHQSLDVAMQSIENMQARGLRVTLENSTHSAAWAAEVDDGNCNSLAYTTGDTLCEAVARAALAATEGRWKPDQ